MEFSPALGVYFDRLDAGLKAAMAVARAARSRGLDPATEPEIPVASDLADRVEALLGYTGIAARLRELEQQMSREEVALKIGDDFARKEFGETTTEEILDHAIRASMALLTEGVVAAPTEGIGKVALGKNDDGTEYLKIYYAGPIRSAGGTAQALSVLVGDYVRQALGINRYIPRPEEVERYIEEIRQYNNIMSLQYLPTEKELRTIISNCPVCIDGEPTEQQEVSGYRNLERVETNTVRGGMALVVAEGLALKAPKVLKNVRKMKMEGWDWLEDLIGGVTTSSDDDDKKAAVKPRDKYLRDLIGGRPVFSYPMRKGGFRLRFGRARNTGFAAAGFHPATLHILGNFLAVGTQMKVERPGKAAGVVPVDTIQGPTVRLKSGEVLRIDDAKQARELGGQVEAIIDIGEILISYGEFLENNHPLMPPCYCEEWWLQEGGPSHPESEMEAIEFALDGAYLHPDYTYLWDDVTPGEIALLADRIVEAGAVEDGALTVPNTPEVKAVLEELLVFHHLKDDRIVIAEYLVLLACLGLTIQLKRRETWTDAPAGDPLALVMHLSGFRLRSRAGTRVGGRMGRPGKSKAREMRPPPHSLFPVGDAGGSRRSFQAAIAAKPRSNTDGGLIEAEVGERRCTACGKMTYKNLCECGSHTVPVFRCSRCGRETAEESCPACGASTVCLQKVTVNIKTEFAAALAHLGMRENAIPLLKGVKGLISRDRPVEPIEKGILRAKQDLYVFKDGTSRYDMIDLPLTHFRPDEVGVSVEKLRSTGYTHDIHGAELTEPSQVLELRHQDILVSEDCGEWLIRGANFIDELLEKVYGLEPFYNVKTRSDLVGHLVMGLAPHTSAGVLARVIGFTKAGVGYGHPFFHAAKRRNCFAGDTEIEVFGEGGGTVVPIRDFVVENFDISRPGLDHLGTFYSDPVRPFFVRSIDSQGTVRMKKVTSVSVHRAPAHLIRFTTKRGRILSVTPEHTMLVWDTDYLRKITAQEVAIGDRVPVLEGTLPICDEIAGREIVKALDDRVYCLTVAETHTLVANGIFTGQCDGDEDCVMLLLDGLINFSRSYLPETRGGTMDAPLVLTTHLDPAEVDKESHNVDVCDHYPLEFYLAALDYTHPKDLDKLIDRVERRLGTPAQLEGFSYTHATSDISAGPLVSTYTILGTMLEKLEAELDLAKMIRAVDADDVAERVLNTHFIRDLMGNLNAFSKQKLRCTKCNAKYRRMPLAGKCTKCKGNVIATVHEGSVKKYLAVSREICEVYAISEYTKQRVRVIDMSIESTFGTPPEQQLGLADFM
ncbi:DNA-directed DNA polymerase II large subunit [Methanoculleus sp. FWC-SCC1]|uniref:DNA polymerase II large subunit n=1 Tax=Methanoculleus frigidifontis TaxID=2584085 RepID=A0ABT8MDS8_9EURY|nr:DNA-directed DNA polymerase II large subunit [Methanoculleus sp. FWC-SCC1]MDN7026100.1 DNA-directed DNA polymerase II large subunit [Methanoculleus sp. FWC-SCC1]